MRALFTTQPGFGHLNPMLPYAVALRDAGHGVRFASAPAFAEAIEAHGFPCDPVGEDFTWERVEEWFPETTDAARKGRAMEYAVFEIGWKRWNRRAAHDLLDLFERWRPDVVVREFAENGATFAGAAAGLPVVCAAWSVLPTDEARWRTVWDWERMLACYAAIADEIGLPAEAPGAAWQRQPVLSPLPPSWVDGPRPAPEVSHFRLPLVEGPAREPPPWLDELGRDRPLVYATLGTVFNKMRRMRAAMLEALGEVDADVLMTVGRDVDPGKLGAVPDNVRVEPFVSQSVVLPRAAAVVSHAGLGTMLGAIYRGVPMVAIALGGDQPVNARRAADLGVATSLGAADATPQALLDATRHALGDEAPRRAAAALRAECDAMAPVVDAVSALEGHAAATTRGGPARHGD